MWGLRLPLPHAWPSPLALGSLIQITKVVGNQEITFLKLRMLQGDLYLMCGSISVSPAQEMKPEKVTKRQKQYVDSAMTTTHIQHFFAHIIMLKIELQNSKSKSLLVFFLNCNKYRTVVFIPKSYRSMRFGYCLIPITQQSLLCNSKQTPSNTWKSCFYIYCRLFFF